MTQLNEKKLKSRVQEISLGLETEGAICSLVAAGCRPESECPCGDPKCKQSAVLSLEFKGDSSDLIEILRHLFTGLSVPDQLQVIAKMANHAAGAMLGNKPPGDVTIQRLPPEGGLVQ